MPTTTATDWPARRCSACITDACRQGRDVCPTPEACALPEDELRCARGAIYGIALGIAAWAALILLLMLGAHIGARLF